MCIEYLKLNCASLTLFIQERTIQELRSVLTHGGGIEESFVSELVTHIIADLPIEDVKSVKGDDCKAVIIHVRIVVSNLRT